MRKKYSLTVPLFKVLLYGIIFFSCLALIYHTRWFIPYLRGNANFVVSGERVSALWYIVQLSSNVIFVIVSLVLMKLFNRFQKTGFFDATSLRVFDVVILSCVILALLGTVLTVYNNYNEVHTEDWLTVSAVLNLTFRSFTNLLVFKQPQTMYFLLALTLWAIKQFVTKALIVKNENEAFV